MDTHENLRQIGNLIKKQVNKDFDELGLTCSQSGVLMFILMNKNKRINQRNIEKEFDLTNPTINGILNRLEKKGLIKRINDNIDKRVKNIIPLKKAEEFIETVKAKKEKMEQNMLRDINKDELNIFYNVLEKMINNLKENLYEKNI